MKKIIFLLLIILNNIQGFSQSCNNHNHSKGPHEHKAGSLPISIKGFPYTMFVKDEKFNLDSTLTKIKFNLINSTHKGNKYSYNSYAQLYKAIWDSANLYPPSTCDDGSGCKHPSWVKNNAIIYLLGLKPDISTATTKDTLIPMTNGNADSIGTKNYYGFRARDGLSNLNPEVEGCPLGGCSHVRKIAFNLIQYIQAYDALRTGKFINDDDDKQYLICSPRMKLRILTKNYYKVAQKVFDSSRGWKKNHGIASASALLTASCVLNSAGVELNYAQFFLGWIVGKGTNWPLLRFSPINWNKVGQEGITENLFVGNHWWPADNVPQCDKNANADSYSPYAEGVGYMQ